MEPDRARARQLAEKSLSQGDPTGWFEELYREQEQGVSVVPWADRGVNPNLLYIPGDGKTALVIGCGLGDDAEQLAAWGFETTAFDVSPTAIRACEQRFSNSPVRYESADLLNPPAAWTSAFDFVLESYTLQALPPKFRAAAIKCVAAFVKPEGKLLVIARARDESDPEGQMPWPLTLSELNLFAACGLREQSFEDYFDRESPPTRRFRALYQRESRRPGPASSTPDVSLGIKA